MIVHDLFTTISNEETFLQVFSNAKVFALKLVENLKEVLPRYMIVEMHSDVCSNNSNFQAYDSLLLIFMGLSQYMFTQFFISIKLILNRQVYWKQINI